MLIVVYIYICDVNCRGRYVSEEMYLDNAIITLFFRYAKKRYAVKTMLIDKQKRERGLS